MGENDTRLIVVLGMHRSGTSVIARGLQVMGVELGNRLMPPSEDNNARGFWEDLDINALNIEMLQSLHRDWHHLTPIEASDVDALCQNGFLQRAIELLQEKTAHTQTFGFKDPRAAKLLPFWKEVFRHGAWHVNYILAIRHPLSVCQSLAKRDGLDFEKSYLLWLEHVIGILAGTEGEKRVLVDYDYFMRTPETELTRLARELELTLNPAELQNFLLEFLDPELQHTIYELKDLSIDEKSPPLLQEVYSSLLDSATGRVNLEHSLPKEKVEQWEKEFSRMRPVLAFVDKLGLKISSLTAERNLLNEKRNALRQESTKLKHALAGKEQALQERNAELLRIHQSRLWRWTRPIRKLLHLFHPRKGHG